MQNLILVNRGLINDTENKEWLENCKNYPAYSELCELRSHIGSTLGN